MEFILLQKKKDYNVIKYSFYLHVFIKNTPLFKGKIKAPLKIVPSKLISKPDLNIISRVITSHLW